MGFRKKDKCRMCWDTLAARDGDVRFRLTDPVLNSPEQHRAEGGRLSDPDPTPATLMQIPNIGPFVRALLPVKLQGGHVLHAEQTPYCVSSPNEELNDVLTREWPDDILGLRP